MSIKLTDDEVTRLIDAKIDLMNITTKCDFCKKEFIRAREGQRFCNAKHRSSYHNIKYKVLREANKGNQDGE